MKRMILRVVATLAFGVSATAAQGANLSLSPLSQEVLLGNQVILLLYADFRDEATLGGGLDITFDGGSLGFVSFDFMAPESVGDDPDFRRDPDVLDGELNGIAFGNFDGMFGRSLVGLITFDTLSAGTSMLTMAANEGGPPDNPGPFVSFATGQPMDVDFFGASVTVVGAVPLPAALWLMTAGLGLLAGFRRRR